MEFSNSKVLIVEKSKSWRLTTSL